jgi:hypothetical protein
VSESRTFVRTNCMNLWSSYEGKLVPTQHRNRHCSGNPLETYLVERSESSIT